MGAVVALGFVGIRQTGKDHGDLCSLRRFHSLGDHFVGSLVGGDAVATGIAHLQTLGGFQCGGGFEAVDVGGTAALEPGLHGKFTDERHLSTFAVICENPDADTLELSAPRFITPGFLRCQPTILRDGRILLCAYDVREGNFHYSESRDHGISWQRRAGARRCCDRNFDEPMILERTDGTLWFLARSGAGVGELAESFSFDGGESWSDAKLSGIADPSARFFLRRLHSGRVLLVKNDSRQQSASCKERTRMTAFLSEDDGRSWKYSLVIDYGDSSYPDAVQAEDGTIYLVHDRGRFSFREIVISRFDENDIISGTLSGDNSFVNQIISKAPAKPADPELYAAQKAEDARFIRRYFG